MVAVGVTVIVRQAQHERAVAAAPHRPGRRRTSESNFGIATGPATTTGGKPRVVVDMYEDFQCPHLPAFESTDGATLKAWQQQGIVQLVYHPVAFLDQASSTDYSTRALMAAASVQDSSPTAFQAFHDLLYANQPAEGSAGLPDSQLADLAAQAGATRCTSPRTWARSGSRPGTVQATDAFSRKYTGTPTGPRRGDPAEGARRGGLKKAVAAAAAAKGPAGSEVSARQSSASVRRAGGDERGEAASLGDPALAVRPLDGHHGEDVAVREIEGDPGVTAAEADGDDLRPLQLGHPHHVPDDEAVGAGRRAQPCEQQQDVRRWRRQQHDPEPVVPAPRDGPVARRQHGEPEQDNGLGHGERDRHPASPERPERTGQRLPRCVRHSRHAWMLVTRIARAPRS